MTNNIGGKGRGFRNLVLGGSQVGEDNTKRGKQNHNRFGIIRVVERKKVKEKRTSSFCTVPQRLSKTITWGKGVGETDKRKKT